MSSRKCHKDNVGLYVKKVESHQQGPPAKRRNCTRYWRRIVGWLGDWMYEKEKTNIIRRLSFFGRKNECFCFRFVFGRKWNFVLVGIFVYDRKWKMLFGRPLIYYITRRSWSWPVAYLGGGGLVRGPPPLWPDRRDFCNYFGIIFSAV